MVNLKFGILDVWLKRFLNKFAIISHRELAADRTTVLGCAAISFDGAQSSRVNFFASMLD